MWCSCWFRVIQGGLTLCTPLLFTRHWRVSRFTISNSIFAPFPNRSIQVHSETLLFKKNVFEDVFDKLWFFNEITKFQNGHAFWLVMLIARFWLVGMTVLYACFRTGQPFSGAAPSGAFSDSGSDTDACPFNPATYSVQTYCGSDLSNRGKKFR